MWRFISGLSFHSASQKFSYRTYNFSRRASERKSRYKSLLTYSTFCVLLSFVLVSLVDPIFTNAEGKNPLQPTTNSIDIFPSEISSSDWKNVETLNYQDLGEQSLFQEFNEQNSAYLDEETLRAVTEPRVQVENNQQQNEYHSEDTAVPENAEVQNNAEERDTGTEPAETQQDPEGGNSINEVPSDTSTGDAPPESEPVTFKNHSQDDSSYLSVFRKVVGNFLLAQAEVTEPLTVDEGTNEPSPSIETEIPLAEVQSTETEGSIESESAQGEGQQGETGADTVSATEVQGQDIESEEVSTDDGTTTHTPTSESGEGADESQSGVYKLTLHDFGIPELASGQFIDNLQLRLSLAGQYDASTSENPGFISVDYSFGEFERNAGSILVEQEASNAMNGGYYLISFPSITDPSLLSDLTVTISFVGDVQQLQSLFIDSVWLEAGIVTFDKELLEERFSTDEMLKHLDGPDFTELLSNRLDFLRDELPQFNLRYTSQRNFFIRALRSLIGSDLASIKEITFRNAEGEPIGASPTYSITTDGLVSIVIDDADRERLKPGLYTVEIQFDEGGYVTTESLEFQWGLLSINSNKTEYSQNDVVSVSMGALTSNGNTVCNATLNLYIANPNGFITNPPVTASGQCFGNNVTDVPDYSAQFIADAPGTYEMYLERLDDNGNIISHTVDTFLVAENQQITIERNGPTRIYPPSMYPMELTVHGLRSAFQGELIERVPGNFRVYNTDARIRTMDGYTELVWDLSIVAGESQTVSYEFDAPDLSPYLYELGPAQLAGTLTPDASLQPTVTPEGEVPVVVEEGTVVTDDTEASDAEPVTGSDTPDSVEITPSETIPGSEETTPPETLPSDTVGESETTPEPAPVEETPNESITIPEVLPNEPVLLPSDVIMDLLLQPEPVIEEATPVSFLQSILGTLVHAQDVTEEVEPVMESTTVISVGEESVTVLEATSTNVVFLEHRQWQIASDATGSMILYWDNASTIPTGWSCLSCGSGSFFQNFAQGNATYNTTGGSATHAHTASATVTPSGLTTIAAGGSGTTAVTAHTHTMSTLTVAATSSLPRYRQLRVIQFTDHAGEPESIPAGAIGIFDVASSSLPSGWTRYAAQDGYYIRGEDTPGTTGGANTHTHPVTGTTTNAAGGTTGAGGGANGASPTHFHTVSTSTGAVSNEPPYIEVLLAKISADGLPPNNMIAMWTDEVPSGWTDVSSAATSTFNGKFIKASTTYGGTGGATNHSHININNASSTNPSAASTDAGGASGASNVHTHKVNIYSFSNPSHLPPYLTVIMGKRANYNPFYTQTSFRWYVNNDLQTPTDVWPQGGTNLAQGEAITATSSPVKNSEVVRLRMNATVQNATSTTGQTFILQYGENISTCDAIGIWNDVGTSTSNTIWRGNNATPADHGTLSSTLLTGSTVSETYEENGYATVTPNQIVVNGVGEWDFVLQNNGATPGTEYCFRMVQGDTAPFFAYTSYPKLLTNYTPSAPTLVTPFDNQKSTTTHPTFSFRATDAESDRLEYEIVVDDSFDFSSPAFTKTSSNYPTDTGWASSTFTSGATTTYTVQPADALSNGTTYWWRVRTRDPQGSNTWSATSTIQSITIDTTLSAHAWFQTLGLQFEDGVQTNISTTTGSVNLSTTTSSVPTVVSGWTSNVVSPGISLTLTKPANVEVGDLLLILVGNDDTTNTDQWDNATLKPSGFTLINESGNNANSQAHSAAFYRIADGTENATTSVPAQASADFWGYYVRVTGASTTNPINVTGADYNGSAAVSHAIPSITTTQANTLAFYMLAGDGADTYPFSVSGAGWSESAEIQAGAGGTESAGTWGTRAMVTAGATGAATVAMNVNDSASGFQFAINPGDPQGTIMSPEIDFDWVPGQADWGDVIWNTTEPANTDVKLRVYYSSTTSCDTLVPNSALSGNSAGFDVSQSGFWISSLSTTTYNRICVKATLSIASGATSPSLDAWTVGWVVPNQVPYTPVLALTPAFEYQKSTTTRPTLGGFASTDYENNALEYEIIVDDDVTLTSPVFTKQSSNYPTDAGWSSATFSAGATTTYIVQSADALTEGITYWWAVRARDPLGTNTWSATSSVRSITISTGNATPEWYQTTNAQFGFNGLANATATGDGIQIATLGSAVVDITTQSGWAQQYANTAYPSGTVNASYSIGAGTDRVLVVAIASTRSTAGTQTVGVYYGGKPLTLATGDGTNATNVNHTYLYYLKDADIVAATSTVLNVQITGGTAYYTFVYASVFAGVNQSVVFTDARNYFDATADGTVGPFAAGLTIGQGDQAIEIVNLARSAVGNNARTVTTWSNATWPNPSTVSTVVTPTANWGVGLHINNRNATTSGTEASAHTANNANTVDSMSGMSLKVSGTGSVGTATSTIIDHDFVPNQSTWGEVAWDATVPTGATLRMRVYYASTSTSTCNVMVPDGELSGNTAGFDVSSSPLNISGLSTTTRNRICLVASFDQASAISSPILNDWSVRWVRSPQFTQEDYRWYQNIDEYNPADAWVSGVTPLSENEPIDMDGAVLPHDELRLRMSLMSTTTSASIGTASFKLQFAEGETCSADLTWYDVGDTASTTALWRGFNNPTIADATILPSTLLTNSDVVESYEERNNSYPNHTAINVGQYGEWDWTLYNNAGVPGSSYCFRMVNADGDLLRSYTNYPSLITNSAPDAPTLYTPFDNEKFASTTPWFEFVTNDPEGNEVDYRIQIDDDPNFGSTAVDTESETNLDDFINIEETSDKTPFNNFARMRYSIPSALTSGITYWWRVQSKDVGSGVYGEWSTADSFTIGSVSFSTWLQTTEAQFDTDTLVGTNATAGNLVAFASGSTTGTTTSTAINFSDGTTGNAWGSFTFTETGSANDILYHLEYYTDGMWELIPDSALPGNTAGYDTSPVDLLDLDSSIYDVIRIRANFRSGAPTLLEWSVTWGERVSVTTHIHPFDNEKFATTTPTFTFHSTDPQGQDLEYEISWSTDYTFSTGTTTRNSSTSPAGFTNLTTGADTVSPYISGDTIAYKVQTADILTASSTYWWRVRAKDPSGSDSFSFWSDPWSFTTATSGEPVIVSTWHQTLGLQFEKGILTDVTTASGSVGIGGGIVLESGWTSNTAVPNSSLTLTKPTGVQVGDLLLIIVGNDNTTATAQWNNIGLKPSGFTFINEAGNASSQAHTAAFYRIADGTEGTTVNVPAQSSNDYWGYYMRLTGVDTASPINVTGTDYNSAANLLNHPVTSITTTVSEALAFYTLSGDGGDTYPFSVAGTGWVEQAEIQAGTLGTNAAGTWGTRAMSTAGATGAATVTMTASDGASGFQFAIRPSPLSSGVIKSPTIDFDDGSGPAWGQLSWKDVELSGSQILYQLEYVNGTGAWEVISNAALSGNETGFTSGPVNLEGLDTTTYNQIRIVGNLDCNGATCPTLNEWTLEWSRGFSISGTAFEYDGTASTTSGSLAVAVNGVLQLGKTGSIQSNGTWTIDDVTFFSGDVVTVFASGVLDADEAVAVTKYDGTPDITGMRLQKRHVTIGSDDSASLSHSDIGTYDFSSDEDLFFNVDGGNDLTMCADVGCADASMRVLARNTYAPGTGTDIITHDFRNDGTFTLGANTMRVGGSWDNNATTTLAGSTVIFTATTTSETVDSTGATTPSFNNVTFGEGLGSATWTLGSALDADSTLSLQYGTLARGTQLLTIGGNLSIGALGVFTGIGTTTFDGVNPTTWSDQSGALQNVGNVVVDGTSGKTTFYTTNVKAQSMTIGADDILDASAANDITIYTNWINNNTFYARSGEVIMAATTTNRTITAGGDAFYDLTFNGAGGLWSFTEALLTIGNDFRVSTGTVNLPPNGTTTLAGSFSSVGGTFAHNNGTVLFTSGSAETISASGTPFENLFYNMTFTGTGSWSFLDTYATTSNNFLLTQGTVTFPSANLSVGGSFTQSGGIFNHNSGTVSFTGAGTYTIDVGASSFNSLAFSGSGSRSFIDANVTALGSVWVTGGSLTLPSGTLSVGGSYGNWTTVNHNSGTVLFNSTDVGETVRLGNSSLNNMTFNSATGGWTITESATTTGNVTLTASASSTLASGKTLAVGGMFTNGVGGATTTWTGSTLSLEAGNYSINGKGNIGDAYDTLRVKANTDIQMWNSTSTVYDIHSTGSLYSQDHNNVDGALYLFGEYVRTSGTEYWSYATDFDGTPLTASTSRQVNVRFASGTTALFGTSTLNIIGTPTATTTVANQGIGTYLVSVLHGTTSASYYSFADLGAKGLTLASSTKVLGLSDGAFTLGVASGTAMTVSSSTIDNATSSLQISRVTFSTTTAITGRNVTQNDGTPTRFWWFRDSAGTIDGEAFDNDTGDPGSIRWDDSSLSIVVSGTVYSDDGVTTMGSPTCNGSSPNVKVVINGGSYATSTWCSPTDGSYSITVDGIIGDVALTTYLDTNGGERGAVVTKTPTGNIANHNIYANRIITKHQDVVPLSISDMAMFDSVDDTDLRFTVATGTVNTLTLLSNTELHIASSTSFNANGNITVQGNASSTSFDGSLHIDDNATFTGYATSTYTLGGSFTMDTGATFTPASTTVIMNATTSGKTITTPSPQEVTFNTLSFTGVGGGWNVNGNIRSAQGIALATGTVTGTGNITVTNGSFSGNGTLSMGSGTTTIEQTNTLGGTTPWTFANLVLGNAISVGTTTPGSNATTTVLGKLTINTAHFLQGGSSVWNLAGTGNVFVESGTFIEATSTVRYSGVASTNILSTTYYNLDLKAQGGSPTYIGMGIGIIVTNNLTVGGPNNTTVNFDTSDPALDVNGTVRIESTGTFVGSASALTTVAGDWVNLGTFTGSGGTITFDGGGTSNISAGSSWFSNLTINGAGAFTVLQHATTSGSFTLTSAGSFTLSPSQSLAVGGTFANNVSGGLTTWANSVLFLYGGGNYTINASTTSDTYGTLSIASGTQIRMWKSDAGTYDVHSAGSLYSQNHANVNGNLYIYGSYTKTSGTDYWNYGTDFEGNVLGSPRIAHVYIANGSSLLYTGGGLAVVGSPTGSTTIQNQGSGTYSLRVGGTASTTWNYYSIRNTDVNGLIFSGTPNIVSLSYGDFEVSQNSGTAITVGGTAIQVKTIVNTYFGTSGASPAYNVTATGTTLNSWKFTNHSGSIAGEAYDIDPGANGGDPGYIVWDNSSTSISVSGVVYSDEGSSISTACDGSNTLRLVVGGATQYTTSCDGDGLGGGTGVYTFTGVSFNIGDSFIVYIDGQTEKGATVSEDTYSTIGNFDLYENRVIVRHEGVDPLSIDDMNAWSSGNDGDVPFATVNGSPDTLTLPANTKLIVWNSKTFRPGGNVTVSGGGGGSPYDGTLELFSNAVFDATGAESHTIGGSLISGSGASIDAETSTFTFTTSGASRTIDTNQNAFYNLTLNGSGSWSVSDSLMTALNDLTITQGALTLPTATTTIGGSFLNTGGSFTQNGGSMYFTASGAKSVRTGSSSFGTTTFNGSGSWSYLSTNSTTTGNLNIMQGTVSAPTGILSVGGSFVNNGTFTHNSGTLRLYGSSSAGLLTLHGSDLGSTTIAGTGTYTMTDTNVALMGTLGIESGSLNLASGTVSIAGSFLNTGGSFNHSSGTILFNSSDTGETINPGNSVFYNVALASAGGGWTISGNATTSGNFSLTSATSFTQSSSTRLTVGGVFTNYVGGGATTWTGSTLTINSGTGYTINTKTSGGDTYNNLIVGSSTALRAWDSAGTITMADTLSSFYSQDHAGVSGALYLYGNYLRTTGADYWSYATDFDGTALGGSPRQVNVYMAQGATTTFTGGTLNIVGANGFDTMIGNQGSGTYTTDILGGTLNALYYSFDDMDADGLTLSGNTLISSLSEGNFTLVVNGGSLITLSSTTLNYNAGLTITSTSFATTTAITGANIEVVGTTPSAWTLTGHTGNLDGEYFDIDGADACSSIHWDDSSCLLTQQSAYRFRNDDGGESVPDSEWYDLSWTKRKRVTITNADPVAYTNATVQFTVTHETGDMQPDFEDLRFTSSDGTTLISHFIETYTGSTQAVVWVEVPTLATSTDTEIYMYYGNNGVSDGSVATTTFAFADTYENGLSAYTGDTPEFTTSGTSAYERTYKLVASDPTNGKTDFGGMYIASNVVQQGQTLRTMAYIDTTSGSGDEMCTLFGTQNQTQNYAVCLELFGTDRLSLAKNVLHRDTSGTVLASTTVTYSTGWYEVEVDWDTDDSMFVTLKKNGAVVATTSATDNGGYTSGGVGYTLWSYHGAWDVYTSRTLTATTPTTTFGGEQVPGGASWRGALNTPATGIDIGDIVRARFLVENTGLQVNNQNYEIEFAPKGVSPSCEAVNYNDFVEVPNQASCTGSAFCMQSSTHFADLDPTTDVLGGDGTFISGQIVEEGSNNTGNITLPQNTYTELEYALTPTADVTDSNYCFRVSNEGTDLDSYSHVAELNLRFTPNITSLNFNGGLDITLMPGTTTRVYATGTVSDMNGWNDLGPATTTFYQNGPVAGVGYTCAPDDNNCYRMTTTGGTCSYTNCADDSCDIVCYADIYYFANPTDSGTYAGDAWTAALEVADLGGAVGSTTSYSPDMVTLRALTVDTTINYGALEVNADTGSYNATTTIQNLGNDGIDISLEGTDLTDGSISVIPVNRQHFATSTFTYNTCTNCTALGSSTANYNVDLAKPISLTPLIDQLFWGIAVPYGVAGVPHFGTNIFYAINDF